MPKNDDSDLDVSKQVLDVKKDDLDILSDAYAKICVFNDLVLLVSDRKNEVEMGLQKYEIVIDTKKIKDKIKKLKGHIIKQRRKAYES